MSDTYNPEVAFPDNAEDAAKLLGAENDRLKSQLAALKKENERLKEIEHRVWHLLDEAIDDGSGELKISIHNNVDLDELNKLLPDDCHETAGERLSIRAERDQLKARVAELEGRICQVVERYNRACSSEGIEAYGRALGAFIASVRLLKEPINKSGSEEDRS